MKIGIPREIKDNENRVALTPAGAGVLVRAGHEVRVEQGAGQGSGFPDAAYAEAGARPSTVSEAWGADLVVKVKEPLPQEYDFLKQQLLFTFPHLAGVPRALTAALLAGKTTAIAYETLEDASGRLPYIVRLAERGIGLLREDAGFGKALNAHGGFLTNREVADSLDLTHRYREFPWD